jgi:hypothetical protein
MSNWQVVFEVRVVGLVSKWARLNQIELDAIHIVLRELGPDGLGWSAMKRFGGSSWDELSEPYKAVAWKAFDERIYRVTLEVRPSRTIIVRDAVCSVYKRGPMGR